MSVPLILSELMANITTRKAATYTIMTGEMSVLRSSLREANEASAPNRKE